MANNLYYPDIYYRIHPHVLQVCNQWEKARAPINESTLNAMIDHVGALALQNDPALRYLFPDEDMQTAQLGGGMFRDILGIILIGELLGRRRRRRFR